MSLSSKEESKRSLLRRSSSVLEREINELQVTTKDAIEKSWREEFKLRRENSIKTKRIIELEEALVENSQRASRSIKFDLDVDWNEDDEDDEDDEASHSSSLKEIKIQNNNAGRTSPSSHITPTPQSEHRKSFPSVKSFFSQKTNQEEELMRQMVLMEEFHKQQMAELELKLRQREAAISTLEKSMSVQINTVDSFRDALETLEKNNRKLHQELDEKTKVIAELRQRVGIEGIPIKRVSKRNTMGSLNSRSSHVRRINSDVGSLNSRSAHARSSSRRCLSMRS